jgi:hypothetical protein
MLCANVPPRSCRTALAPRLFAAAWRRRPSAAINSTTSLSDSYHSTSMLAALRLDTAKTFVD